MPKRPRGEDHGEGSSDAHVAIALIAAIGAYMDIDSGPQVPFFVRGLI